MTTPDKLAAYLDEAVSRALGDRTDEHITATPASVDRERRRLPTDGSLQKIALRLAHNRAGHALRVVTGTSEHLRALRLEFDDLKSTHHRTWILAAELQQRVAEFDGAMRREVEHRVGTLHAAIAGLELAMDEMAMTIERISVSSAAEAADARRLDEDIDAFYEDLELRFRGATDDIKSRIRPWVPLIDRLRDRGSPLLDVGSGRGEWLAVLREEGIRASGVDINERFAAMCADDGLDVVRADAFEYLESVPEGSLGAVTAFQFIEHLTTPQLLRFIELTFRALRTGGGIVFETPSPSNLRVAAMSFYLDPTHQRPIHEEFLRFALERTGFVRYERHYANPVAGAPDVSGEIDRAKSPQVADLLEHVHWALFGPQDYAVAAIKPSVA